MYKILLNRVPFLVKLALLSCVMFDNLLIRPLMDMVGSSEFTLLESFITPNAAFAHLILLHFCCSFDH